MEKKIWQLENDKIYKLKNHDTLFKVWENKMFYFNNSIKDWAELDDGYGLYIEIVE